MQPVVYRELLEALPFWNSLTDKERELVNGRLAVLHYRAGQPVRGGNVDCLGLVLTVTGSLRAFLLSPDGREVTLYHVREGECCVLSVACALDAVSFDTQVEAEADSEVLLIPIDVYSSLLKENIYVERDTYKMATERFSDVVAGVERLVFFSLEQRLVSFLLDVLAETGGDTVHMTHEQIAVNIGSAREAVSRTLKGMESRGLVELFRGGLRLADKPALYGMLASKR